MSVPTMSTEEFLEHYGVKGQKWGVRKERITAGDIRGARRRVTKKAVDLEAQRDAVKATARKSPERAAEKKKLADMKLDFLKDPDRATSLRMTRGEKAALGVLGVVTSGGITTVAAGTAVLATRKVIEKRQRTGYYDKARG